MQLGYLVTEKTFGPPYTLDEAYPFVRGRRVALGFPDILIEPQNAYARTPGTTGGNISRYRALII